MSVTRGTPNPVALGLLRMTLDRDAEIDRLTAALDAAQRETASHRHAALFAALSAALHAALSSHRPVFMAESLRFLDPRIALETWIFNASDIWSF